MHGQANWSMSLGRWGGIAFRVHILFFLFAVVTLFLGWQQRHEQDMLWIAIASISILFVSVLIHELAHYFAARRHGLDSSLPYFIPIPIGLVGTLGAIIRMRKPFETRNSLFDVGAAGPLAGILVAI